MIPHPVVHISIPGSLEYAGHGHERRRFRERYENGDGSDHALEHDGLCSDRHHVAVYVLLEKVTPQRRWSNVVTWATGAGMVAWGVWVILTVPGS